MSEKKEWNIAMETQIIPDEIMEELTLKNRYAFLNANLANVLEDNEKRFFNKIQRFCLRYERKNNIKHDEDFYEWIPAFGEKGYVTRAANFDVCGVDYGDKWGLTYEFLRCLAVDMFDPMFNMAMGATVLCINPLLHHHENREECLTPMKELVTGQAIGCICITEPLKGSDATHLDTKVERADNGLYITGTKCYNTNAPKSKYAVVYGTENPAAPDSDKSMAQCLVEFPNETVTIRRAYIPSVPRIWIGYEEFNRTFVPKERILCDVGKGKYGLFEGLVPERMGIALLDIAECWGAFSYAAIYSNIRKQMGKEIIKHQAVGFLLTRYWSKITALTMAILSFCRKYDSLIQEYEGKIPDMIAATLTLAASQFKYEASVLSERTCYEMANLMGGAGVNDNTLMKEYLGISRIQEIVGGTSQIQQYLMSRFLRRVWKIGKTMF
ncbi:MAG: acyl-CoA dehydrogenase family protein [Promethearchaeota archaeon]